MLTSKGVRSTKEAWRRNMKIQDNHIDLTKPGEIVYISFKARTQIQLEMIRDHAWLNHLELEEAAYSWVEKGWAALFANHYLLK